MTQELPPTIALARAMEQRSQDRRFVELLNLAQEAKSASIYGCPEGEFVSASEAPDDVAHMGITFDTKKGPVRVPVVGVLEFFYRDIDKFPSDNTNGSTVIQGVFDNQNWVIPRQSWIEMERLVKQAITWYPLEDWLTNPPPFPTDPKQAHFLYPDSALAEGPTPAGC